MGILKTFGLRSYYQMRRIAKALKNWRRFGVVIFGGLFLATTMIVPTGSTAGTILTMAQISPSQVIMDQGETKQFSATSYDQYGNPINSGVSYTWNVVNPTAGSISATGLFTSGSTAGQYDDAVKLTARLGASVKYAYADVTVSANGGGGTTNTILTTVAMTPSTIIVDKNETKQFNAKSYDQFGDLITSGVSYTWSMANATAGSVNSSGLFTSGSSAGQFNNSVKLTASLGASTKFAYGDVTVSNSGGGSQNTILTTLVMTPSLAIMDKGDTKQFNAKSYDQFGDLITSGVSYTWSVVNSTAGSVNQAGLFTAGQTANQYVDVLKVTANYGASTKFAYGTITVSQGAESPVLHEVVLLPAVTTVQEGDNQQFTATSYDQFGNVISSGVTYVWSVSNASAGTINQNGLFTANTAGFYVNVVRVDATWNSVTKFDRSTVVVTPDQQPSELVSVEVLPQTVILDQGETQQYTAIAYDQFNQPITSGVSYTWSVINGGGTISSTSGFFTAGLVAGTFGDTVQVRAIQGANTAYDWATVTVNPNIPTSDLYRVEIDPQLAVLEVGDPQQFTATSYDQNNNVISSGVVYTWSVINGGGTINSVNGLFTAGQITGTFSGTVRVRATMGSNVRYDYATVIVNDGTIQNNLHRVEIIPPSRTVNVNQSTDFNAQAYDINNNPIFSGVTYTWDVISGPGAIDANGTYTATSSTGTRTVQVRASKGGVDRYDTAIVEVIGSSTCSDILSYVIITPYRADLTPNQSFDFDAQAYDSNGCPVSATYTWDVINGTAGSINQNGFFTAGTTTGSFLDTVRVRAYKSGIERSDTADVYVTDSGIGAGLTATLVATDENGGTALPGEIIRYDLQVTNNSAQTVTNTQVLMDLPNYTTLMSVSSASGNGVPSINNRTISWFAGTIVPGQSKFLTLKVWINDGTASGTIIDTRAQLSSTQVATFWAEANDIIVGGTTPPVNPPLTPTGVMGWLLAAFSALLATIFTRWHLAIRRARQLVI